MTVVTLTRTYPKAAGGTAPATGTVKAVPTSLDGGVLPIAVRERIVNGSATLNLDPTDDGQWAWKVTTKVGTETFTDYKAVPASGPVDYDDLVDVDPVTLAPTATLEDTFWTTLTSNVTEAVENAVEAHTPGMELGYAERVTPGSTTQIAANSNALIAGLVVTVVGQGRPVLIQFTCQGIYHSVANTGVTGYLEVNGSVTLPQCQSATVSSPSTSSGRTMNINRRTILANGVSYTIKVGIFGTAAGTSIATAATFAAMQLSVISR